jgi:hypothetical protein
MEGQVHWRSNLHDFRVPSPQEGFFDTTKYFDVGFLLPALFVLARKGCRQLDWSQLVSDGHMY